MTPKPHYTSDIVNKVIRLRMAGWHPREICDIVGRTKRAIDRLLSTEKRKRNLAYPKLIYINKKWIDTEIERIAKKYKGKTYREIGEEEGITSPRVSFLMAARAHGLQNGTWRA